MLRTQQNAWIHASATVAVLGTGFWFGFSRSEWCWIVVATISVWTAEALPATHLSSHQSLRPARLQ